jgi:hypothetical protein
MTYRRNMPLAKAFEKFDAENPHVYRALVDVTRQMYERGMRRVSVDFVYHIARWSIITATNDIGFKLNDHYTAFYARLIMWLEDDLDGMFALRPSEADEWARLTFVYAEPT